MVRCEDSPNKHSKNKDTTNTLSKTMIPTSSKDATFMPVPRTKQHVLTMSNTEHEGKIKKENSKNYYELNKTKAKRGFAKLCLVVTDEKGQPCQTCRSEAISSLI